jgi:hypothetical protein
MTKYRMQGQWFVLRKPESLGSWRLVVDHDNRGFDTYEAAMDFADKDSEKSMRGTEFVICRVGNHYVSCDPRVAPKHLKEVKEGYW